LTNRWSSSRENLARRRPPWTAHEIGGVCDVSSEADRAESWPDLAHKSIAGNSIMITSCDLIIFRSKKH
jgi:hypothetical protein